MADGALSIKLRCASWQQLATIYKRDLSQGTMFLKAATPPAVGTQVQIDLTLPSATVIALAGVVHAHLADPQRGAGIELRLAPIPAGSVWLIESALASENRRLATTPAHGVSVVTAHHMTGVIPTIPTIGEAADVVEAERDLIRALVSEAESLKKLNPFLVLGVGYEATDAEVRAAFGELTKRYHPDRFARYESGELREVAAEIFILIRDAYRRLADAASRVQVLHGLGKPAPAPRAVPGPQRTTSAVSRTQRVPLPLAPTAVIATVPPPLGSTAPAGSGVSPAGGPPGSPPPPGGPSAPTAILTSSSVVVVPPRPPTTPPANQPAGPPPGPAAPRRPGDRPPGAPSGPPASAPPGPPSGPPSGNDPPGRTPPRRATTEGGPPPLPRAPSVPGVPTLPAAPAGEPPDPSALEELLDQGKFDEALAGYRMMVKRHPHDRNVRAGVELCEGLRALAARDRLEAAQRFEAALEIDPSNERAARELAEMRRQATNERKGLLSRLMGKKEP